MSDNISTESDTKFDSIKNYADNIIKYTNNLRDKISG